MVPLVLLCVLQMQLDGVLASKGAAPAKDAQHSSHSRGEGQLTTVPVAYQRFS
jgi:hypothetical protein